MTQKKLKPPFGAGAIPSPRDYRDVPYSRIIAAADPTPLPSKHLEPIEKLPVWHQRKIGACVGHAAGIYKVWLDYLETGKFHKLSARFLYALAKCRDGVSGEGTFPSLVAKIVKDHGVATEKTVKNDTTLKHEAYVYNRKETGIPADAWKEAKQFAIKGYAFPNVNKLTELKRAIIDQHGAMLLMRLGDEWYTDEKGKSSWDDDDVVPLRAPKEVVSGHEVFLYGYEDVGNRTKLYIHNSWSVDWAIKGRAWFWYDEYRPYLNEAITFVDLPNDILDEVNELPAEEKFKHTFLVDLKYGQTSEEVKKLQTALRIDGVYTGPVTGFYGPLTSAGVLAFWKKYALTSWLENITLAGRNVGPKTRTKLNALFSK